VFFDALAEYAPLAGVRTASGVFVVATTDRHLGRHLFIKRSRPEMRVLDRAVAILRILTGEDAVTARVFIDVGANIGTSTVAALVSHRFGSAVACEPEEGNFRLLRVNLMANGLDANARALRVAASDRIGKAELVVPRESGAFSWIALEHDRIEDIEASRPRRAAEQPGTELGIDVAEVELVTLDRLVESGEIDPAEVGMLWIDAEAHEGHILRGATTLTGRGVPIVFEFDPFGLDERGDRDRVHEIVEHSYTHFVDVRRPVRDETEQRFRLRAVTELSEYAGRFLDAARPRGFTDLLVLRLSADQAKLGEKLPELMSGRHGDPGDEAASAEEG
jgi:FkbM family methyltransferase